MHNGYPRVQGSGDSNSTQDTWNLDTRVPTNANHLGLVAIDYKIYEHVVDVTHRFKEIFYDASSNE